MTFGSSSDSSFSLLSSIVLRTFSAKASASSCVANPLVHSIARSEFASISPANSAVTILSIASSSVTVLAGSVTTSLSGASSTTIFGPSPPSFSCCRLCRISKASLVVSVAPSSTSIASSSPSCATSSPSGNVSPLDMANVRASAFAGIDTAENSKSSHSS